MGFGFVEYRRPEQAQKALKQLQVSRVLGHPCEATARGKQSSLPLHSHFDSLSPVILQLWDWSVPGTVFTWVR